MMMMMTFLQDVNTIYIDVGLIFILHVILYTMDFSLILILIPYTMDV